MLIGESKNPLLRQFSQSDIPRGSFHLIFLNPVLALPPHDQHDRWEHNLADCHWDYTEGVQRTLKLWFHKKDFKAYPLPLLFSTPLFLLVQGNEINVSVQNTWHKMKMLNGSFKQKAKIAYPFTKYPSNTP